MGRMITTDQQHPSREALDAAYEVLAHGGVLVMPTDSVYGIGCAALPNNPAHQRIFAIKHRDLTQTLPLLVADPQDLDRYGDEVPSWARAAAEAFWPGALTLVVRASRLVGEQYVKPAAPSEVPTVALRCPDSAFVRTLARSLGCALATTSANTHGLAAPADGAHIEARIVEEADLTVDGGPAPCAIASTIVDCTHEKPRLLREGSISYREFMRAVGMGGRI
ncbi:MAG: L-threonylcarbamoyladenylate synthase [Atopobiaceae bacterium]|jgi:release factor glutamine methyltransferase